LLGRRLLRGGLLGCRIGRGLLRRRLLGGLLGGGLLRHGLLRGLLGLLLRHRLVLPLLRNGLGRIGDRLGRRGGFDFLGRVRRRDLGHLGGRLGLGRARCRDLGQTALRLGQPVLLHLELLQALLETGDLRGDVALLLAVGREVGGVLLRVLVLDGGLCGLVGHYSTPCTWVVAAGCYSL